MKVLIFVVLLWIVIFGVFTLTGMIITEFDKYELPGVVDGAKFIANCLTVIISIGWFVFITVLPLID